MLSKKLLNSTQRLVEGTPIIGRNLYKITKESTVGLLFYEEFLLAALSQS